MTDGIFQLGGLDARAASAGASPFLRFGHEQNPFPDSGIRQDVFYYRHILDPVREINSWLASTQNVAGDRGPYPPLALQGALGVGKSHLLAVVERGLTGQPRTPVHRIALTEDHTSRLLLANLLLVGAQQIRPSTDHSLLGGLAGSSNFPLIDAVVDVIHRAPQLDELSSKVADLDRLQPSINAMIAAARRSETADLVDRRDLFARYLQRGRLTPGQLARLNVAGTLQGEGDTIRLLAQLLILSRRLGLLQTWYFLLDQLEDLWRVVSSGRRARFLTDLRTLIDQCLEGAPIAVLLAWNTAAADREQVGGSGKVDQHIREEYRALWRRMEKQVDLRPLRPDDIWPFADAYLSAAERAAPDQGDDPRDRRATFRKQLQARAAQVEKDLAADPEALLGSAAYSANRVLHHWRLAADGLAR